VQDLPRFIQRAPTDQSGLVEEAELPYHLAPRDVVRLVEDLHDLLHDINRMLVDRGYERMEELLDPAGFSGFISRTIVDRIARLSRALERNLYHNGYPDLLPRGAYPGSAVQHGDRGGLEVKASRGNSSWQAHGPRAGWFLVVQFDLDHDESKAQQDREPTRVLAVLLAELLESDWSWQPAAPGRIRSGTASIKPSGAMKLRRGAAWVEPTYRAEHDDRLIQACREAWRPTATTDCLYILDQASQPLTPAEVADAAGEMIGVPGSRLLSTVRSVLSNLVRDGAVIRPRPGFYQAVGAP
jgi:hypothetical protein